MASSGRPCGPAHNAPRTRACRYAARVTVVTPLALPVTMPTARSRVLRQLGLPLRGVWALTSSELLWAVPDGPT
jgi:hypothetical protein